MPTEISWEIRERAEELYILEGLTYEQVAEQTGVSLTQLKRWGADGGWTERRREHRQALSDIKRNTTKLRQKLIENALNSLDPQAVYAAVRLEALSSKNQPMEEPEAAVDRPKLFLEDMEFVAQVLKDIDPEGLKVLARNFETIVARFKEQHAQAA